MNQINDCMSRHGGQPEGVKGQSAVAPLFSMDSVFFRAQTRLKNRKAGGDVKVGDAVRPLFCPELATVDAKDNDQRWLHYQRKLIARKAA